MFKIKDFPSMADAIRANILYQRAEEHWQRRRLRSAFRCFLAAARAGMAPAFGPLAQFYDFGQGTRVNEDAALYWYRRASRHGDCSAANNVGCIWRDRKKLDRALMWFHRAVEMGDDDANLNIARIYLHQRPNPKKAVPYLKRVCRSHHVTEGSQEEAQRLLNTLRRTRKARFA